MNARRRAGSDRRRLRLSMAAFFLALAVPTAVLVMHAFGQLKWEAFHQYRQVALAVSARVDAELARWLEVEEARSFADYAFLVVAGDPAANFVQRSALSAFPPDATLPGLVGHFQVDAAGRFSTPLLPGGDEPASRYGVGAAERARRLALESRIREVLSDNRLVEGRSPRRRPPDAPVREAEERATTGGELPRLDAAVPPSAAVASTADRRAAASADSAGASGVAAPTVPAPASTPASVQRAGEDSGGAAAAAAGQQATIAPPPVAPQAAFDQLKGKSSGIAEARRAGAARLGRIEDLELMSRYFERDASVPRQALEGAMLEDRPAAGGRREPRRERGVLPEAGSPRPAGVQPRIRTFESELDPFEFSLLDSGHFVLFRKVWREGQRFIQGLLVEQRPFLDGVVGRAFAASALADASRLAVAFDGDLLWAAGAGRDGDTFASAEDLSGALLHRERLSAPFSDLELVFTVARLPHGPGAQVVAWVAAVIAIVLCGGLALMYRLGARQLALARQQQDFVSAVSHELRTPLTSIRLYAEMLQQGWADEARKRQYYQYIFDESERLSRLIANVLQLARMTRDELAVETRAVAVSALLDGIASKVASVVERAGFELVLSRDDALAGVRVQVDEDAFNQIVINLVDNAVKFAGDAAVKRVEVGCRAGAGDGIVFTVRDHGPGIARDQRTKIFRLFYRSSDKLTRETAGTGIGLALVDELARAMGARVDVCNAEPGAMFSLWVPRAAAPARE